MALPQLIDKANPADSDNPSAGAAVIRQLKTFLEDVFGLTDATNYTAAAFTITTAGLITVKQTPFTLGAGVSFVVNSTGPHAMGGATVAGAALSIYTASGETVRVVEGAGWSTDISGRGLRINGASLLSFRGETTSTIRFDGEQIEVVLGANNNNNFALTPRQGGSTTGASFEVRNAADTDGIRIEYLSNTTPLISVTGSLVANRAVTIEGKNATSVALAVRGKAGQAAVLQTWTLSDDTVAVSLSALASVSSLAFASRSLGNDTAGPRIAVGRNTNAGAEGPAAGVLQLTTATASDQNFWVDATGKLRINDAGPTGSSGTPTVSDTAGSVVGDQTSLRSLKTSLARAVNPNAVLASVVALRPEWFLHRQYPDDETLGLLIEEGARPWYSQDNGKSLNIRSLMGHFAVSIQLLDRRLTDAEAALAAL